MAFTLITQGSFDSDGTLKKIDVPQSADYFKTVNQTQMGLTGSVCVAGEWFKGVTPANDGLRWRKAGSSAILIDHFSTSSASDGFTYVTSSPVVEAQAANAITAITAASPAVVSQTNTYAEDDIVRIYNTTGMLQYGGMPVQISTVSGSGYSLIGIRAAGLTAGTAGNTRRISKFAAVDPEILYVTEITQAASAVVRFSVDPTKYYVVGMKIHFSVPASFGMVEINQLTGTITAMSAANYTVTVNIDSTAFTAFAFPLTTASPTARLFATIAPAGARTRLNPTTGLYEGYNFDLQPFHTGEFTPYMALAGGSASPAGASGDKIIWQAFKMEALLNE